MLLIHAARVVNMRVDFADVVEITNRLLGGRMDRIPFTLPVRGAL